MLVKEPRRKIALHRNCKARVAFVCGPVCQNSLLLCPVTEHKFIMIFEIYTVRFMFSGLSSKVDIQTTTDVRKHQLIGWPVYFLLVALVRSCSEATIGIDYTNEIEESQLEAIWLNIVKETMNTVKCCKGGPRQVCLGLCCDKLRMPLVESNLTVMYLLVRRSRWACVCLMFLCWNMGPA